MNPIAHVAVGCGVVWAGSRLAGGDGATGRRRRLVQEIDYRFVAVGALLPDLIDKPLGTVLFRDHFDANGHIYGHTLLGALIVLAAGAALLRGRGQATVLAMGVAYLLHLLLDPVNHAPRNFLWPLLGTGFDDVTFLGPAATVLVEALAAALVAGAGWVLWRRGALGRALRTGRLP